MPSITLSLLEFVRDLVLVAGYPGIFLAMFVEGVITPIPSEIVLPLAGFLASEGRFNPFLVILVASLGATAGSTIAYHIGYYLGRQFVLRWGMYFGLREEHLDRAENWFRKYGDITIFLGHSFPGTRSFISFPAGIGKMKLRNFVIFTFLGATVWNSVLTSIGYFLGEHWESFVGLLEYLDVIIFVAAIALIVFYLLWRRNQKS